MRVFPLHGASRELETRLSSCEMAREDSVLVSSSTESTPRELYEVAKQEFDRLTACHSDARVWREYAIRLMESLLQAQGAALECQRRVTDAFRTRAADDTLPQLRSDSRDALYYMDKLTEIYRRVTGAFGR
jgi:hypothetical protein